MRRFAVLAFLAFPAFAQQFQTNAFVSARGVLDDDVSLSAQAGVTWTPSAWLELHVSGVGHADDEDNSGGLVEAYADLHRGDFALRAGQFFLPTSRENKAALWTSPYTLTFSAVNSWIAEEVRPIGVDLGWRHETARGHVFSAAATAFRGNDSMGALLAWRGWAMHNRLSAYNEVLPLPPLASLQTFFAKQRDDGTKPFGADLDGRTGYAARARWSLPERASVQLTHVDNNGDRLLHRGEYAWNTSYDQVGVELGDPERLVVAVEYMDGRTGMGLKTNPAWVDADFSAGYVLVSEKHGRNRFTARFDRFDTDEKDFSPAEVNEQSGRAWTFAWLVDVTPSLRGGAEWLRVSGDETVTLELRYAF